MGELPIILALDPGGTTGYCGIVPHRDPDQGELSKEGHHEELWDLLVKATDVARDHHTQLTVVCEAFEFRQEDAATRPKIDYMAAHYEGVVELYCKFVSNRFLKPLVPEVVLVKQYASQVKGQGKKGRSKTFWGDDAKIKKLGLWKPGKPHAMDATRHYLYYVTFTLGDKRYLHKLGKSD